MNERHDSADGRLGVGLLEKFVGRAASVDLLVDIDDCASQVGSGDLPVLASPTVLALAERAAVAAASAELPDGTTTVGTYAELRHLAPTLPGETVTATATVASASTKSINFDITVTSGVGTVALLVHRRSLVQKAVFMQRAQSAIGGAAE